ncbi:alkaline phosphatase family protein [Haloprofundus salilacus]|uniref:alkaline phosphatase family protein n=1 Tax=Haloprofundus salilacus TaxID=2876190 RepID=UPI001CCA540D|nr:alkaline phosphatase family protein [Haloprofundus salilacus]
MTVYVVGLDGADWSLLRDGIDAGDFPGLARIVDEGVTGNLESTLPPITFPAWKCYSTGKNPGKLGVYEWFGFDRESRSITTNDSSNFRSREYWDVLSDEGVTPAVVNMPTTHPPKTDDGVLTVAGSPASEHGEFTKPNSLKSELLDAVPEYRTKPDLVLDEATPEELISEAKTLADQRFDAAEWFADEKGCGLVHLTVFVTDTVQHRLWDRPEKIRELYERIDRRLTALLDREDTEAVFLMSDHGFAEIDETFLVNQWLADRGDLVVGDAGGRNALATVGITRERLKRTVARLGLVNLAQALIPESMQRFFPSESGRVAIQDAPVDWAETKAISLGRGPIYLNDAAFESDAARASYRKSLTEALSSLETPNGDPVAAAVHEPDEIYSGELHRAPDLVVEYATGVDAPEAIGGRVFGERTEWLATHRRQGVFGAWGDGFGSGRFDCSLYDLAPTILHWFGAPVPADVDGEVQRAILVGEPQQRGVEEGPETATTGGGETAGGEVEETLRDLGYID